MIKCKYPLHHKTTHLLSSLTLECAGTMRMPSNFFFRNRLPLSGIILGINNCQHEKTRFGLQILEEIFDLKHFNIKLISENHHFSQIV